MKEPSLTLAIMLSLVTTVMGQNIRITDYDFIAPQGWQVINKGNHFFIQSPESGCQILMFEPQPSSGNLDDDAMGVFAMMYPAPNWRYTYEGERKYVLSRGYLPTGLRYSMVEAPMNATTADGLYHTEDGAALVIQAGNQVIIISVRHSSLMSHWDCRNKYDRWSRFFNSLDVKRAERPTETIPDPQKRIIGVWKLASGGVAAGEYIFAANGNVKLTGAIGSSTTTSDYYYEYTYITSYAFEGDGSYLLDGNKLILKRPTETVPQQRQFRFEEVNHGGTGWIERIYLLSYDASIDGLTEVCYEKALQK